MANIPADLKYTKEHEWVKIQGDTALVGITDHAQHELGDVVFVEMPALGKEVKQEKEFGVVESVKTVSNLYSPLSGKVKEINKNLEAKPETINSDPYGEGWIIKLESISGAELENLLSAEQYKELIEA
jgi:glycine cleavage system H protein